MFELKPMNKWLVIEPLKEDEKVGTAGLIIAPDNAREKQHGMARVVAKDDSEEAKNIKVGDIVFYDKIGQCQGRVGNQEFTTVSVKNVIAVVAEKTKVATTFKEILDATGEKLPEPQKSPLVVENDEVVPRTEEAKQRLIELATKKMDYEFPRAKGAVGVIDYPGDTIPGVDPNKVVG